MSGQSLPEVPVLIAGGGPVGMTLALVLASRGIRSVLVERNAATTRHPKMDITNSRSMELFRQIGMADDLRAVGAPDDNPFDVSWITTLAGYQLYRFRYPSASEMRRYIREHNDGSQPTEPAMRASQVEIEPVLKRAIDASPLVDVQFGVALEDFTETADGVNAIVRSSSGTSRIHCSYLIGCDGGTSRVRSILNIALTGASRIMQRYTVHFRSNSRELLQRWGVAWHYQSPRGTLVSQNDWDIWTLHCRIPPDIDVQTLDPSASLTNFAGKTFEHEILVANPWKPHLVVADSYQRGRVLLAGDAVHQYIPTGGYGMNTGIGDAFDLGWKIAAVLKGFGGPRLLASYEEERRPVGLRNCDGSRRHNQVRMDISALYSPALESGDEQGQAARDELTARIKAFGNAENESFGLELGYSYANSSIVCAEPDAEVSDDPIPYIPNTVPGSRLPSVFLNDGRPLFDLLGQWFTLISTRPNGGEMLVDAARRRGMPLCVLPLNEPGLAPIYKAKLLLVRPDQHVAWRGSSVEDEHSADAILSRVTGWA